MLQDLIDQARFEVFSDYDMFEAIRTRAVVFFQDGLPAVIELPPAEGLFELERMLENAVRAIEALGGRTAFVLTYVREKRRDLLFISGFNETEKGICALELKRHTGDPVRDLLPVSDVTDDANRILELLEWGGSRRKVDVRIPKRDLTAEAKFERELADSPEGEALTEHIFKAVRDYVDFLDRHDMIWETGDWPRRKAEALMVTADFALDPMGILDITLKGGALDHAYGDGANPRPRKFRFRRPRCKPSSASQSRQRE
jgi:hypothetical protein